MLQHGFSISPGGCFRSFAQTASRLRNAWSPAISRRGLRDWRPPVATTIVDAQRVPSAIVPGGIFVTHVHTRLPDSQPGLGNP
jgi:hypothetical protein